ncbi:MAG: LecA/PA-IL family lectin [Pyrinomonadaceae bacterium]|jgi:hypothetical protein|nr:LecA/PA-IL family lectin [Pyrinomonadaceae bacterium]
MLLKSKFFRVTLALSLLLCLFVAVFADTIRLKDGSVVKGKVVGFSEGKFIIVIGEGSRQRQITYYADEVERIEFDSAPNTPSNAVRVTNSANTTAVQPTPKPTVVTTNTSNNNTSGSTRPNSNNVIIVGGNRNTNTNQTSANTNSSNTNSNNSANNNSATNSRPQPITMKVRVLADNTANGWTNAGWVVKRGQKIRISGSGRISLGNGRYSTPSGVSSLPDSGKLLKNEATGVLIAVIGDDNNDFITIGDSREFVAQRDGILFLGINEGNLDDNSGAFDVTIEVELTK